MKLPWSDDFQRTVLALFAVTPCPPNLVRALGDGAMFAPVASGLPSPRARLARLISEHWSRFASPPGWPLLWERLRVLVLPDTERAALFQEWSALKVIPVPGEPGAVWEEVERWLLRAALGRAVVRAAEQLDREDISPLDIQRDLIDALPSSETIPGAGTLYNWVDDADERIRLWQEGEERGPAVPTGLGALDSALDGGVRYGEAFYVLAPPKGGKTTLQLTAALGAARSGYSVLMISYEMRARPVLFRLDRGLTNATKAELRDDPKRIERMLRGWHAAGAGSVWVYESSPMRPRACDEAARVVERIRRTGHPVDLLVLDYLNIMGASRDEREKRHELARTSREISALAKREQLAIWSAALVNRKAVEKEHIERTDIAEAFEVIAVADGVVALCGTSEMRSTNKRGVFLTALREEADERMVAYYEVDFGRLTMREVTEMETTSEE